jgi:hypothetical protein
MKVEDVDWEKAKEVVEQEKPNWYEEYDEAEGLFMGWRKLKTHNPVTFSEFIKWWEPRSKSSPTGI